MARLSVTLDEDVAAWVQEEAQRRGVSKAKVLLDCVTIAMETGTSNAHNTDHDTRFDDLEARVAALEAAVDDVPSHENETASDSSSDAPTDASAEDVQAHLERVLADRPPATPHGQAAVITTALLLREHGSMQTQDLRNAVYECHGETYASTASLWQSIQRYLADVPGIEKPGRGEWAYAGDDAVFAATL